MNTQQLIQAMSQDLYRAAICLQRGSLIVANRFIQEAKQKLSELQPLKKDRYLDKLVSRTLPLLSKQNDETAEHLLMYSILFRNYALKD